MLNLLSQKSVNQLTTCHFKLSTYGISMYISYKSGIDILTLLQTPVLLSAKVTIITVISQTTAVSLQSFLSAREVGEIGGNIGQPSNLGEKYFYTM